MRKQEPIVELEKLTAQCHSTDVSDKAFEMSARFGQTGQRLLDDYNDIAMRIISRTPATLGEMRAILTFFLADEKIRAATDERASILIRSLLRSSVLVGVNQSETASDTKIRSGRLLQTSGALRKEAANEKRYRACSDGRPVTEVLNFAETIRAARYVLFEHPDANLSIYDTVTAIHYL